MFHEHASEVTDLRRMKARKTATIEMQKKKKKRKQQVQNLVEQ